MSDLLKHKPIDPAEENKNFFVVDIHTHILPKDLPDFKQKFGYGEWIQLEHHKPCCARMKMDGEFFREIESNNWDPKIRTEEMNQLGVDVHVLSTVPVMFSYWTKPKDGLYVSQFLNDHMMDCVHKYPKNFVALGNLPMQDPDLAIKELERCKKIGMKGVQIGSHINDWNLNEPALFPIFEAIQDLDMSVFVHPWWWMSQNKTPDYWLSWLCGMPYESSVAICSMLFSGIFEKLPNLRVAFAHGGGAFPGTIGRIEQGWKARPDLVHIDNPHNPKKYLGQFWLDSIVHDRRMLDYLVELVGADKIALGTDYPYPLGEPDAGLLIHQNEFNNPIKEKLLSGSALSWLKMKREDFL